MHVAQHDYCYSTLLNNRIRFIFFSVRENDQNIQNLVFSAKHYIYIKYNDVYKSQSTAINDVSVRPWEK